VVVDDEVVDAVSPSAACTCAMISVSAPKEERRERIAWVSTLERPAVPAVAEGEGWEDVDAGVIVEGVETVGVVTGVDTVADDDPPPAPPGQTAVMVYGVELV